MRDGVFWLGGGGESLGGGGLSSRGSHEALMFSPQSRDLTVSVAEERLRADSSLSEWTALSAEQVVKLCQFCLEATYFAYRGEPFKKTFGSHGLLSVSDSGQPGDGKCRGNSTVHIPVPSFLLEKVHEWNSDSLPCTSEHHQSIQRVTVPATNNYIFYSLFFRLLYQPLSTMEQSPSWWTRISIHYRTKGHICADWPQQTAPQCKQPDICWCEQQQLGLSWFLSVMHKHQW